MKKVFFFFYPARVPGHLGSLEREDARHGGGGIDGEESPQTGIRAFVATRLVSAPWSPVPSFVSGSGVTRWKEREARGKNEKQR